MNIQHLLRGEVQKLILQEEISIPSTWYQNTDILHLSPIKMEGEISYLEEDSILMNAKCSGVMYLPDSVSLEEISYPFSFEIEENLKERLENDQNDLDILSILWENIVLEIPIHYSNVKDYKKFQGDGWKLVSEDDYQKPAGNNPFQDLLEKIEEE